jgi:hypothetical protein
VNHYLVEWRIDIYADSPREAAEQALAIQRKPDSTATVFNVTDTDGTTTDVDLLEDEEITGMMEG